MMPQRGDLPGVNRSFANAYAGGTGDITGLRSRIYRLSPLGIDAIWISPWFDSPPRDAGHDVADCRAVHLRYGSVEEARELVEECPHRPRPPTDRRAGPGGV
ncbi:alpha-amylase family glycosyl hydrolase [Plantactinospora sp. CA-294935]|uniref:alpha-amylase family glycosyl hydrolase n=1 Tax=Plantactinospora sp. CA-294935 TaxID=3240012 RepID=UPI003D905CF0